MNAEDNKQVLNTGRRATKEKLKSDSRENSNSRKKARPNLECENETKSRKPPRKSVELEVDPLILQRRQKQIDYGKNTVGYYNYIQKVSFDKRTKEDPKTPDKFSKYSRRSWDMLIKIWRRKLHEYDDEDKSNNLESDEKDELSDELDC